MIKLTLQLEYDPETHEYVCLIDSTYGTGTFRAHSLSTLLCNIGLALFDKGIGQLLRDRAQIHKH